MTLRDLLIFIPLAVVLRLAGRGRARGWLLMIATVLAVYWLQPLTPIRYLDYWLPTLTLGLAVLGWVLTTPAEQRNWRSNGITAGVVAGVALLVGLTRWLSTDGILTAARPPQTELVLAGLAALALIGLGLNQWSKRSNSVLWGAIGVLLALLVVLKLPPLAQAASEALRGLMQQSTSGASGLDIRWLGFSYLAFRMIHTLRDRQSGRLPVVTLQEYLVYLLFFPALTAGPIDRLDRFLKDLRKPLPALFALRPLRQAQGERSADTPLRPAQGERSADTPLRPAQVERNADNPLRPPQNEGRQAQGERSADTPLRPPQNEGRPLRQAQGERGATEIDDFAQAGKRLVLGMLKKYALADSLALIALNPVNAGQVQGAGWQWIVVYAYALQIFLDFSGYTDIAIGLGRILGIHLPENFNAPYLKTNLTLFWNNWHMTLTQWFRAYFFNPLTRALRTAKRPLAAVWVILVTQVATFVLIGLWHGITWNFVLWGLWQGVGLFVQNRYSEWARQHVWPQVEQRGWQRPVSFLGGVLTFHYVALGWVWFALPNPGLSLAVLARLFGG